MPRKSKETILTEIHAASLAEFGRVQTAQRDERTQCLQDRRFYSIAGAMWEGPLEKQWANKPRLEVNKVLMAVIQVINEYRNNRFTVEFINKDGTPNSPEADVCNGLFRADEQDSVAQEAYDNAFEEAAGGGFGAFRLRAEYEDEDDEREYQRVRIEPIVDADKSVFFDLDSKRQDKADATRCWVLYSMAQEAFTEQWGYDPSSMPVLVQQQEFDWCTPDLVYLADYYVVEKVRDTAVKFRHLDGSTEEVMQSALDDDEENEILADMKMRSARRIGQRSIRTRRVRKYIMSGDRILEDCGYIAGKCIPVVPVYGKRWWVEGTERMMGIVRPAKDLQRILNMQVSAMAELSALSPREKPIFLPEQVAGHELMWAEDNLVNNPFLLVNPITDAAGQGQPAGPIGMTATPQIPPAMGALIQITDSSMRDMLGTSQDVDKMVSNISGKAVEMIQERVDGRAFILMDNFAKSVRRCGEVWKSMAADLYVEAGRKMKAIGRLGDTSSVTLMRPVVGASSVAEVENDLSKTALFDVAVSIGPSSRSKKQATHRNIMEMLAICTDPQTQQVLQSLAFVNMDGEGLTDVQAYFRKKLVDAGVMPPTDEERAEMEKTEANQQPDPQQQALLAYAEAEKAKATKARADTLLTIKNAGKVEAETERTQAETAQIVMDTGLEPDRLLLDAATKLGTRPRNPLDVARK
jgi:hypothetical protein